MRINQDEFEKTVDTYSDVMLRCAYTYCGNRADAEDIVQGNKTDIDENIADNDNPLVNCEIWENVRKLPAKYRILVELYYGEGYTMEEITKITGVKKSTVSDQLKKARELLEKMYKEE